MVDPTREQQTSLSLSIYCIFKRLGSIQVYLLAISVLLGHIWLAQVSFVSPVKQMCFNT